MPCLNLATRVRRKHLDSIMTDPKLTEEFEALRALADEQDIPFMEDHEEAQTAESSETGDSDEPTAEETQEEQEGGDDGSADADSPDARSDDDPETEEPEKAPEESGEELSPREQKKLSKAQESWEKANAKHQEALAAQAQAEQRLAEIAQREQELKARERELEDPVPGHTAEDLAKHAKKWAEEGETELAQKAIDAILAKAKHQLAGQSTQTEAEFQAAWEANKQAVVKANPELTDAESPLTKAALGILSGGFGNALRAHPQGVALAVEAAKLQLASDRASGLEAEVERLKAENAQLSKKLSVDAPSAPGAPAESKAKNPKWKTGDSESRDKVWEQLKREAKGVSTADLG